MGNAWQFAGWFYKGEGQAVGPLSTDQVRQLLASGRLEQRGRFWKKWTRPAECLLAPAAPEAALEEDTNPG
jgi:hypothetical protein